jgi:hypothetical protein
MTRAGLRTVLLASLLAVPLAAQQPAGRRLPGAMPPEEATLLVNGYASLAQGDHAQALEKAREARARFPRSVATLTFAIEVEIARGGAKAGLDLYESWLGGRSLEEPAIVRRIAMASLREFAAQTQDGLSRDAALWALADEGDADAYREIFESAQRVDIGSIRQLAERGDERAVKSLLASFETPMPNLVATIMSLGESGSPLVIEPLTRKLTHPDDAIRGTAAEALARAGGPAVAPRIRPLLNDSRAFVRASAAGALFRLGDYSGMPILQELMDSEHQRGRLRAAELMASRPDERWLALVRGLANPVGGVPADDGGRTELLAAQLLLTHDSATARGALERLAAGANPTLRDEASRLLASDPAAPFPALRRLLRHSDWLTRVHAAASIARQTRS